MKDVGKRKGKEKGVVLSWSIGTKLIVLMLVMIIIPISTIVYYNLTQSRDEVAKVAMENLEEISCGTSYQIEQLLMENQRTSATLAGEPIVVQFLTAPEEERQTLTSQLYETLQNFADTHPDYDAPGILDANGIVVASLEEILVGKDRSFRDYFQASIQGESYVSGILVGRATGRPGVFLTNPVVTAEGDIIGIDIIWLKADTIWTIIDNVVIGKEGIAYLVDQDGVIIAHSNRSLLYHSLGELTPEAKEIINSTIRFGTINNTDIPLIPESLGMDGLADALVLNERFGTYRFKSPLDNRDHMVGYTHFEEYPLTVIVDVPEVQFLSPLQRLSSMALFSVVLTIAIVLIISILLVRGITRPICRLTDAAIAVEHDQPFDPSDIEDVTSGRDEIAHLGHVFGDMVLSLQEEVTERKKAEEELRKYSEKLEELVEERTKELCDAHEELVRKEKLASIGQLASGIGHELRNPLGVIGNSAYYLNMKLKDADDKVRKHVEIMQREVRRANNIITDLLDFSRVRPPSLEEGNVNGIIKDTLADIKLPENISVETQLNEKLPGILVDADQIRQVFLNVISNAVQAMPEGGRLDIKTGIKNDFAEIMLRDTGEGIPKEQLQKIFEPLFTKKAKGIGLGLSIAKDIVEGHKGKIEVESEVGEGTTFTIKLPLQRIEEKGG